MIEQNISLSTLTTFGIGGYAKYLIRVKTKKDLLEALEFQEKQKCNLFVLGGGSNVLVNDDGFNGLVIKIENENFSLKESDNKVFATSGAGKSWDSLVELAVSKNLQGIESLSGVPGTTGAAPVQNIGAYGQEIKDTLTSLVVYDIKNKKFVEFKNKDCKFGYRDSFFKSNRNKFIIWEVTLKLYKNKKPEVLYASLKKYLEDNNLKNPTLLDIRTAVLTLRKNNHIDPAVAGNAGSFFKNPIISKAKFAQIQEKYPDIPFYEAGENIKLFAAWLIEKCGWKGKAHKNVSVSPKHALILINHTKAGNSREIRELAAKITKDVYNKFDIKLEPEVQYI